MKVKVIYTGRSYQTATLLPSELLLPEGASTSEALETLRDQVGDTEQLPSSCLIAVSGEHLGTLAHHISRPLREGDELVLIAPVAGG